jgi:hypothetical protein
MTEGGVERRCLNSSPSCYSGMDPNIQNYFCFINQTRSFHTFAGHGRLAEGAMCYEGLNPSAD